MSVDPPHITAEQADLHVAAGLPPAERAAVDAHILTCPTCAAMIANATAADASLRSLLSAVRPSAALEADIVGRLRTAQRMRLSPPARRAAVVAAAAVVVIGTGWLGSAYLNAGERAKLADNSGSDVFMVPSSNAQKWDFGGGSNTALNWANWNGDAGWANSFSYENPFATTTAISKAWNLVRPDGYRSATPAPNPPKDGSNVMPAGGRAEWGKNPFTGTQHDNVFTGRTHRADSGITTATGKVGQETRQLDWASSVGNAAVPGSSATDVSRGGQSPSDNADSILLPTVDGGSDDKRAAAAAAAPSPVSGHDYFSDAGGKGATAGEQEQKAAPKPADDLGLLLDRAMGPNGGSAVKKAMAVKGAGVPLAAAEVPFEHHHEVNAGEQQPDVPTSRPAVDTRRVIRTSTMSFDVDRFDAAADTLAKVVGEAGGFVGTIDSQKLPNGKTQGTITVRCPPERLDLLVLSLRSLGDLKSQQIVAQDVTKEYTDLEAELTADRAMQDRLLELIRTGKGSIKDLLGAENELGTWRTKIEHAEGQLRYMNGQIGLSTLAVTLSERDIRQAASTVETETADMGVEADDVEHARDGAIKAIDDAKGRIVEAELKRLDAGQLAARIVADVPPEMAGATIDRIKQLGRVARLEVHRQQTAVDSGTTSTATPLRTERRPTRIVLSIYNLANVAPRRTTVITLAANDPESAYAALLALASPGGRVVTSNLDRSANATGTVSLEVPPARLEAVLSAIRANGEVLKRATNENADTQNTTDAKVGLNVLLVALSSVAPRETVQQTVAAADVPTAYRAITSAASVAHAHVRTAELNEQDRRNATGTIDVDVPRSALADFDRAVGSAGDTVSRSSTRAPEGDNTADAAVRVRLSLASADNLSARETTTLAIEVTDADKSAADAQAVAVAAGGRVLSADLSRSPAGPATAKVALDVPLSRAADVIRDLRQLGAVRGIDAGRDANAPAGPLAHVHVELTLATADALVADSSGPWANVRHGLSVGLTGLLWSLQLIVVGLCLLVPWAAVAYVARRLWRRWGAASVRG